MVLTNELLAIGFSLVSNFANVVSIPADAVPRTVADLSKIVVGSPHSPVDVSLFHHQGMIFRIRDGAVYMFESPDSFMSLQDPARIPKFLGKPVLGSNDVLQLATKTVERLARTTNPVAGITPLVKADRKFRGENIPFYEITWPKPHFRGGFGYFAGVEIDARDGKITHLELHDPSFCNYALAQEISNRVYVAEPPKASRLKTAPQPASQSVPRVRLFPLPTTNEVNQAISGWLWICRMLDLVSGTNLTLNAVNWDRTCIFTNQPMVSSTDVVCRVEFLGGAWGLSLRGVPVSFYPSNACFSGWWRDRTAEEWIPFRGIIKKRWQDLAKTLEETFIDKLEVSAETLSGYAPHVEFGPPDQFGTENLKCVNVQWMHRRKPYALGFAAEFDVETGELKGIAFCDPKIFEAVARARSKAR